MHAADEFAAHVTHFSRTSQFKCNRLIGQMRTLAEQLCAASATAEAAYVREQTWPQLERLCTNTLHNLVLDLR